MMVTAELYPVCAIIQGVAIADHFLWDWLEWLERTHCGGRRHPEEDFFELMECCSVLHDARFLAFPRLPVTAQYGRPATSPKRSMLEAHFMSELCFRSMSCLPPAALGQDLRKGDRSFFSVGFPDGCLSMSLGCRQGESHHFGF